MKPKINIAIFASGSGTNAENIVKHFQGHTQIKVSEIFSNKEDAYVLERAKTLGIPSSTFNRVGFTSPGFLEKLARVDYIILAGFLWLVPEYLVEAFPNKIINIHPALLPKYGGKGMYGDRVHQAVIQAKEKESGITIHLVNQQYDKGKILFQSTCDVTEEDTSDTLANKIHKLEYEFFPKVIEEYILG